MSGHSKWHNIQKTKGAQDAKRAQAFTKIAREMIVAVKEGGSGDPANNSRLAAVITKAIDAANKYLKDNNLQLNIEIETRSLDDVRRVLEHGGVQRIMFDNFTPDQIREGVKMVDHRVETEASGGIVKETLHDYAVTGVDFISVGAFTHQIKSLDMSLKAL